jgi:hypothetical protein
MAAYYPTTASEMKALSPTSNPEHGRARENRQKAEAR